MKLRPVRIEEKPEMKIPERRGDHVSGGIGRAERRVKCPAGVDAAANQRIQIVQCRPA